MQPLVKLYSLGTTICTLNQMSCKVIEMCGWQSVHGSSASTTLAACFLVTPVKVQIWDCSKSSLDMLLGNIVKDEGANCSSSPRCHPDTGREWDWQGINSIPCSTLLTDQLTCWASQWSSVPNIFYLLSLLKKWEKSIDIFIGGCVVERKHCYAHWDNL